MDSWTSKFHISTFLFELVDPNSKFLAFILDSARMSLLILRTRLAMMKAHGL